MFSSYPFYYHNYAFGFPGKRQVYGLLKQGLYGYQCNAPMFPEILRVNGVPTASFTTNPMLTDFNLITRSNYDVIKKNRFAKSSFRVEKTTCDNHIADFCKWASDKDENMEASD